LHPTKSYAELETGTTLLAFLSERFLAETQVFGAIRIRRSRLDDDPLPAMIALASDDVSADFNRAAEAGAAVIAAPEIKPWGDLAAYATATA
jgi:lactoylglutathione lyase